MADDPDQSGGDKGFLDKPRTWITDDRTGKQPYSIRQLGQGVKEGVGNMIDLARERGLLSNKEKADARYGKKDGQ